MGRRSAALLVVALATPIACTHAASRPVVTTSGDRSGLKLRMTLTSTSSSFVVETRVANRRRTAVHLVPDQCGRVTEVVLARTGFEPVGRSWPGSLGAVKHNIVSTSARIRTPTASSRGAPATPRHAYPAARARLAR
jgi:hypothetical protein